MVVDVVCGGCGTTIHVLPPETSALLDAVVPADEKTQLPSRLAALVDADGGRFAIADSAGLFLCPVCAVTTDSRHS
jgi:hypothetical protein